MYIPRFAGDMRKTWPNFYKDGAEETRVRESRRDNGVYATLDHLGSTVWCSISIHNLIRNIQVSQPKIRSDQIVSRDNARFPRVFL